MGQGADEEMVGDRLLDVAPASHEALIQKLLKFVRRRIGKEEIVLPAVYAQQLVPILKQQRSRNPVVRAGLFSVVDAAVAFSGTNPSVHDPEIAVLQQAAVLADADCAEACGLRTVQVGLPDAVLNGGALRRRVLRHDHVQLVPAVVKSVVAQLGLR